MVDCLGLLSDALTVFISFASVSSAADDGFVDRMLLLGYLRQNGTCLQLDLLIYVVGWNGILRASGGTKLLFLHIFSLEVSCV